MGIVVIQHFTGFVTTMSDFLAMQAGLQLCGGRGANFRPPGHAVRTLSFTRIPQIYRYPRTCRLDFSFAAGAVQSSARPATATTLAIVSAVFVVALNGIITRVVAWANRAERYAPAAQGLGFYGIASAVCCYTCLSMLVLACMPSVATQLPALLHRSQPHTCAR